MMNKKVMGNCKSGLLYLEIGIDVFFELEMVLICQ